MMGDVCWFLPSHSIYGCVGRGSLSALSGSQFVIANHKQETLGGGKVFI